MSLVKRHPIITFFVLTYLLTWAIESPLVFLTDSVTATQGLVLILTHYLALTFRDAARHTVYSRHRTPSGHVVHSRGRG